jgi:hypothetical protein
MPLYENKPVAPAHELKLDPSKHGKKQVWVIPYSDEVFVNYRYYFIKKNDITSKSKFRTLYVFYILSRSFLSAWCLNCRHLNIVNFCQLIYPIIYLFFSLNRDYLNRIVFYNKSQWQCAVTGRQGLTYEEALENEKKHREQLKKFPRGLKQHILQMVQFSKYTIFKYFVVSSPNKNSLHVLY